MMKAAEDLKRQQMIKEQERQAILAERISSQLSLNPIKSDFNQLKLSYQNWPYHILKSRRIIRQ